MEASFSVFHVCAALVQRPPTQHHHSHQPGGTGSARTREGARTTSMVLALLAPPLLWGDVGRTEGVSTPPLLQLLWKKKQQPPWRRHGALWRFLATLPAIRCDRAPDLNRAHPQGVNRDPLGSSTLLAGQQARETAALRAFFERAASATVLYVM